MTADVWEPYSLEEGQRVRVRLSGECRQYHEPEEDGATGYIDSITTQAELDIDNAKAIDPQDIVTIEDAHVYWVMFDDPDRFPPPKGWPSRLAWHDETLFCAAELVPIED